MMKINITEHQAIISFDKYKVYFNDRGFTTIELTIDGNTIQKPLIYYRPAIRVTNTDQGNYVEIKSVNMYGHEFKFMLHESPCFQHIARSTIMFLIAPHMETDKTDEFLIDLVNELFDYSNIY